MNDLKTLIEAFPRIFRGEPPRVMSYLSPGWASLLTVLFGRIDQMLTDEQARRFSVLQIKEKFGALRLYWGIDGAQQEVRVDIHQPGVERISIRSTGGDESPDDALLRLAISRLVQEAEAWSAEICERCGNPGVTNESGWLLTLCDEHKKAREIEYAADWGDGT